MKMQRFYATSMPQALRDIRQQLGQDAVILSTNTLADGVEVIAAMDYEDGVLRESAQPASAPARATLATHDPLNEMKRELHALRNIIANQACTTEWQRLRIQHPNYAECIERLQQIGFQQETCQRYLKPSDHEDFATTWTHCLHQIAQQISCLDEEACQEGGRFVYLGPTGVGKTTTIAKLAARYALRYGAQNVGLITTDCYRISAHEQLQTYGKILDIPVFVAENKSQLQHYLYKLRQKTWVLIDTAGLSQRDTRLPEHLALFQNLELAIRPVLLLSANQQQGMSKEVVQQFGQVKLHHCILSKLDECTCLGALLDLIIAQQLPIAYTTNGQRVPEDLHRAHPQALIDHAVSLAVDHDISVNPHHDQGAMHA